MAITLKRQLTPEEKAIILQRHGRVCFATGHAIPEQDSLHFDHVLAFALGGRSELDNIAPMCEQHNKAKGMLPLEDFRVSLQLQEFRRQADSQAPLAVPQDSESNTKLRRALHHHAGRR